MGMNGPVRAGRQRCLRGEISLLEPATDIIEQTGSLRQDARRHAAPARHRAPRAGRPPRAPGAAPPTSRARRDGPRRVRAIVVAVVAIGVVVAIPPAVYLVAANSPLGGSVTPCSVCRLAIPSSGPVPNVPGVRVPPARPSRPHKNVPSEMAKVSTLAVAPAPTPSSVMTAPTPASYFSWFLAGFGWWGYGDRGFGGHGHRPGGFGGPGHGGGGFGHDGGGLRGR